jgi:hypothetical protein
MAADPELHEQPWLGTRIKARLSTQTFASGKSKIHGLQTRREKKNEIEQRRKW